MLQKIETTKLDTWKNNFDDQSLEVKTKSAIVDLKILKDFIQETEQKYPGFNGVRIYFIRYDENDGLNGYSTHIEKVINSNLSQVSLAFVPVEKFNPKTLTGKDIIQNNEIFTLAICHPQFDYDMNDPTIAKGSGLCPPKCKS